MISQDSQDVSSIQEACTACAVALTLLAVGALALWGESTAQTTEPETVPVLSEHEFNFEMNKIPTVKE